jgi:TPR repeat protein
MRYRLTTIFITDMNNLLKSHRMRIFVLNSILALSCCAAQAAIPSNEKANRKLDSASASIQKHQYHRAFKQLHKLAKQGHPTAQHIVGMMYENGIGVEKNLSKAVSYYEKSAMQDFGDAQCTLGRMYQQGNAVVVKDAEKARDWLTKAAERNIPEAEYNLGMMHAKGDGVPQDLAKASQYLQRASAHGVDDAKDALAKLPPMPNYQGGGAGNALGSAGQNYGQGLSNIQQAWSGYGDMVKTLKSANGAVN